LVLFWSCYFGLGLKNLVLLTSLNYLKPNYLADLSKICLRQCHI